MLAPAREDVTNGGAAAGELPAAYFANHVRLEWRYDHAGTWNPFLGSKGRPDFRPKQRTGLGRLSLASEQTNARNAKAAGFPRPLRANRQLAITFGD